MTLHTRFTESFGVDHPIVSAPMDLVSTAALATAVSRAGGLGLIGGGYGDGEWLSRELAAAAGTRVLEPWCEVEVTVPAEYVGAVMSDLSARRARVTGSEAASDRDRTTVRAEVPEVELLSYPGVLRSVSHGTGGFVRRPLGYEPAPASVAAVPA